MDSNGFDQDPRRMEWGILKEKFRAAAAAERSDEIEGVDDRGDVLNDD